MQYESFGNILYGLTCLNHRQRAFELLSWITDRKIRGNSSLSHWKSMVNLEVRIWFVLSPESLSESCAH